MQDIDFKQFYERKSVCLWVSNIDDWRRVDSRHLIVWAPNKRRPYLVELHGSCSGLLGNDTLAFKGRTERICGLVGESVFVGDERCGIANIYPLEVDEVLRLLPKKNDKATWR